jgi:hypothetical protein
LLVILCPRKGLLLLGIIKFVLKLLCVHSTLLVGLIYLHQFSVSTLLLYGYSEPL